MASSDYLDEYIVTKKSVTKMMEGLYLIRVGFIAKYQSDTKIEAEVSAQYSTGQSFSDIWKDKIDDKIEKIIDNYGDEQDVYEDEDLDEAIASINTKLNGE